MAQNNKNTEYYNEVTGRVIVRIMCHYNDKYECIGENKIQLDQTYSLKKGLKVLRDKGKKAAYQEMNQIHKRTTFEPVRKEELTESDLKRAMENLTFLEEKRDGRIKGRTCAVGSTQR